MKILDEITRLSHECGTDEFVMGGGGNSSAKDSKTIWVKPSGTTLKDISAEDFLALDRSAISELYTTEPPSEPAQRDAFLLEKMTSAKISDDPRRPSVEASLHNLLETNYVMHTHPALVNGMTCSINAASACQRLFPEALWMEYIDPGYELCMAVRGRIADYHKEHGTNPELIFLKNHGVFVAADTAERVRSLYAEIFQRLSNEYKEKGISAELNVAAPPEKEYVKKATDQIREILSGKEPPVICASGYFDPAEGPVSPDHILYAESFPLRGPVSRENVDAFISRYNRPPRIIAQENAVFALGNTEKRAGLAMDVAKDAALVRQLSAAFGGINYLSESIRAYIENWEAEVYRNNQI